MDEIISTRMIIMEGVTSTRMAATGTWTVPVVALANDLKIIMP